MLDKYAQAIVFLCESNISSLIHRLLTCSRFHKMLATDEMRAWYGPDHVALAADRGAIGTLLISDELFR